MITGKLGAGLNKSRAKSKLGLPWHSSSAILKGNTRKKESILSSNSRSEITAEELQSLETRDLLEEQELIVRKFFDSRRKWRSYTRIQG